MPDRPLADLIYESGLSLDTRIKDLHDPGVTTAPVTWQATKPLTSAYVQTLGQLADHTDEDLLTYTGFGPGRLDALKNAILGAGQRSTDG